MARNEDPSWCLVIDIDDLEDTRLKAAESLLCLTDGMIGTRAVLEEDTAWAVRAAGLYQPAPDVTEALMPLPGWCMLPLVPGLSAGRRVLDLRDGTLSRVAVRGGRQLSTVRFACLARWSRCTYCPGPLGQPPGRGRDGRVTTWPAPP